MQRKNRQIQKHYSLVRSILDSKDLGEIVSRMIKYLGGCDEEKRLTVFDICSPNSSKENRLAMVLRRGKKKRFRKKDAKFDLNK